VEFRKDTSLSPGISIEVVAIALFLLVTTQEQDISDLSILSLSLHAWLEQHLRELGSALVLSLAFGEEGDKETSLELNFVLHWPNQELVSGKLGHKLHMDLLAFLQLAIGIDLPQLVEVPKLIRLSSSLVLEYIVVIMPPGILFEVDLSYLRVVRIAHSPHGSVLKHEVSLRINRGEHLSVTGEERHHSVVEVSVELVHLEDVSLLHIHADCLHAVLTPEELLDFIALLTLHL